MKRALFAFIFWSLLPNKALALIPEAQFMECSRKVHAAPGLVIGPRSPLYYQCYYYWPDYVIESMCGVNSLWQYTTAAVPMFKFCQNFPVPKREHKSLQNHPRNIEK